VLNVEGMTCTGCEESIQKSVNALPGIVEVTASHTDSLTTVAFDPGLASVEQIQEAITKVGYIVTGFHFEEEQAGPDTLTPQE